MTMAVTGSQNVAVQQTPPKTKVAIKRKKSKAPAIGAAIGATVGAGVGAYSVKTLSALNFFYGLSKNK